MTTKRPDAVSRRALLRGAFTPRECGGGGAPRVDRAGSVAPPPVEPDWDAALPDVLAALDDLTGIFDPPPPTSGDDHALP